jgi:hypothetical protein
MIIFIVAYLTFLKVPPNGLRFTPHAFAEYTPSGYGWENQLTKRYEISRLNQAQNAEPTSLPAFLPGASCRGVRFVGRRL